MSRLQLTAKRVNSVELDADDVFKHVVRDQFCDGGSDSDDEHRQSLQSTMPTTSKLVLFCTNQTGVTDLYLYLPLA